MKILAFDTSNGSLSVAILFDDKIVSQYYSFQSSTQAESLICNIEKCLNEANIWYQDLNLIAVTNGPGSFTGVRVGFSAAKAIKLATNLPLIGINTSHIIAYDYKSGVYHEEEYNKILVVMDAKLDEFFIQEFDLVNNNIVPTYDPKLIEANKISDFLPKEKFLLSGSAKELILKKLNNHKFILSTNEDVVKAINLAFLARKIYDSGSQEDIDISYIRKPRISKRKK